MTNHSSYMTKNLIYFATQVANKSDIHFSNKMVCTISPHVDIKGKN